MPEFPLIFGFRTSVMGSGFLAGVQVDGRALLVEQDGEWWAYGVVPGAFAASGATPLGAYQALRQAMQQVLFDSASLATSFEAFKADVTDIYAQQDPSDAERWQAARLAIREGKVNPQGSLDDLPRRTEDVPAKVTVVRLDQVESQRFSPGDNQVDQVQTAA